MRQSGEKEKWQLTGKIILPKASVYIYSIVLEIHQDKIINFTVLNPTLVDLGTLALTLILSEVTPLPDPEPCASILLLSLRASTPLSMVTLTLYLPFPA